MDSKIRNPGPELYSKGMESTKENYEMYGISWAEITGAVRKDYDGINYYEREELKSDAWKRYSEADSSEAMAEAIEDVILAHYDRSREGYKGKHPDFHKYARYWVAANGARYPKVFSILQRKYPKPKNRHVRDGETYWNSRPITGKTGV